MNVQRFVGKNARQAIALARAACGEHAVILSNRPVPGGVEIVAMADGDLPQAIEGALAQASPARSAVPSEPVTPDAMSTVSFQDYVRERQRRRETPAAAPVAAPAPAVAATPTFRQPPVEPGRFARESLDRLLEEPLPLAAPPAIAAAPAAEPADPSPALMEELRSMRQMLSQQLAGLSWFDTARRSPAQTRLLRLLIGNGFSPALARQLVQRLPDDVSDAQAETWLLSLLAHNLRCADEAQSIQQAGGVHAIVGPTGVGKTTTTAKIAARFAMAHGAASVGLITVDTYRMAASDQLRGFGRLLNIPVHTARDAASLADLLNLFTNKKLVLIDTVGVGQRDRRLAELFAALPSHRISRLLVLNAVAQGDTLDEVARAYGTGPGTRCVLSKVDEAARCGPVIDVAMRHRFVIEGLANGQRVPEDWHAVRPMLLAQKALLRAASPYDMDDADIGLLLTSPPAVSARREAARA